MEKTNPSTDRIVNFQNVRLDEDLLGSEFFEGEMTLRQERRMPAVIVADASGSMRPYEVLIQKCLNSMYDQFLSDPATRAALELGVISFNDEIVIEQPLCELTSQDPAFLKNERFATGGYTYTGLALKTALDMVQARVELYGRKRKKFYAPVLFLLSDGLPNAADPEIAKQNDQALEWSIRRIRELVAENKLSVFSIEVDGACDHKLMRQLTGLETDGHVIRLHGGEEFSKVFQITSQFLVRYSQPGANHSLINEKSFEELLREAE